MASLDAHLTTAQRATHPRLHIRNAQEAHTLFEGVRLGLFPMVRRRLSPTERELQSGEVFVWEEASYKGGLERWTDGRKWSQSRMREPFLFYEEKVLPSREEKDAKAARRARKTSDPQSDTAFDAASSCGPIFRRQDRPTKLRGLTKQTYSAYVTPPGSNGPPKKWHLTAYFSTSDYSELPTVQQDPLLRTIEVPKGVYVTGKGLTRKSNRGVGSGSQQSSSSSSHPSVVVPPPPSQSMDEDSPRSHYHHSPATSFASPRPYESSVSSYSPRPHYSLPPSSMPTPSMSSASSAFAAPTDEGSRSPWSSSSAASLPVTPPPLAPSLPPAASPSSHQFPRLSDVPRDYYQPQPSTYDYRRPVERSDDRSRARPAVYDSEDFCQRSEWSSPPHRHTPPYLSAQLNGSGFNLPPIEDKHHSTTYQSPLPSPPVVYPQSFPSSGPGVQYPSSDVRGEAYPPPPLPSSSSIMTAPLSSIAPSASAGLKYKPRSSMDQKALGAFRLAL